MSLNNTEGVDRSVMLRFTGHADATIARWLSRMGNHAQGWHNHLFRNLVFTVLQLDELYTHVRGSASARWLWLALDCNNMKKPSNVRGIAGRICAFSPRWELFLL